MKNMFLLAAAALALLGLAVVAYAAPTASGYVAGASIADSWHNLSATGVGNVNSVGGTQEICVFCHTPHNASNAQLIWNKGDFAAWPNQTADFGSPGGTTQMGTPNNNVTLTPSTLRCLTCHDGSTSVGQVNFIYNSGGATASTALPMTGADQTAGKISNNLFVVGSGVVGGKRDMSKNHPVSIPYAGSTYNTIISGGGTTPDNFVAEATVVAAGGEILKGGVAGAYGVECSSCHDVHGQADSSKSSTMPSHLGQMVKVGMDSSNLCLTCHIK